MYDAQDGLTSVAAPRPPHLTFSRFCSFACVALVRQENDEIMVLHAMFNINVLIFFH